jgi:hypothetical protein
MKRKKQMNKYTTITFFFMLSAQLCSDSDTFWFEEEQIWEKLQRDTRISLEH